MQSAHSNYLGGMEQLQNLIGGQLQGSKNGKWLDNIEPATGAVYGQIPRSDADDVELAVQAAAKAFPQWSTRSFEDRSECLRRWAKIVAQHADELVRAESKDNGKPISLAEAVDIPRAQKTSNFLREPSSTLLLKHTFLPTARTFITPTANPLVS